MEDLIQRLKKWNKKPHGGHAHKKGVGEAPPTTLDLDLASPTDSEEEDEIPDVLQGEIARLEPRFKVKILPIFTPDMLTAPPRYLPLVIS